MKVLFLHGWHSVPGGVKPTYLKHAGHDVLSPALPDDDFDEAVWIAQAVFDRHQSGVIVGSASTVDQRHATDLDKAEHFVRVNWLDTVPEDHAFDEGGLFGNQNTVCKPTTPKWRHTVERLKTVFPHWDDARSA